MDKDSAGTRIPRLDGISRIPMPGSLRPPSKLLRAPTTFATPRPISFSGLRPPNSLLMSSGALLKKSSSGERINHAVNMVSKKTTTAIKKFFSKPERPSTPQHTPARKPVTALIGSATSHDQTHVLTPRPPLTPLTRSDTFITDNGDANATHELLSLTQAHLAQSTPAPAAQLHASSKMPINERTCLLSTPSTRHALYTTRSLDEATMTPPAAPTGLGETMTLDVTKTVLQRTHILESARKSVLGFGTTIDLDSPRGEHKLNGTQLLSNTHVVMSSTVCMEPKELHEHMGNTMTLANSTQLLGETITLAGQHAELQGQTFDACQALHATQMLAQHAAHELLHETQTLQTTQKHEPAEDLLLLGETITLTEQHVKLQGQTFDAGQVFHGTQLLAAHEQLHETHTLNTAQKHELAEEDLLHLDDISLPADNDLDVTLKALPLENALDNSYARLMDLTGEMLDDTLPVLAPDKANLKLPLNSTMNTSRLLDISNAQMLTPARHMQLLNLTRDLQSPAAEAAAAQLNNTQLLYMTHLSSASTTPERPSTQQHQMLRPIRALLAPLKGAQSEMLLPTRTPDEDARDFDDELVSEPMDVDTTLTALTTRTAHFYGQQQQKQQQQAAVSLQELHQLDGKQKSRFSFGLDLTESTLDCSIELCDVSLSSTAQSQPAQNSTCIGGNNALSPTSAQQQQLLLKKQHSFELDESLGILTPDQMKEFLDSTTTNNTNTNNNNSNMELPLMLHGGGGNTNGNVGAKMSFHQMRFDQTPSPEELPLDPVEVKTDITDVVLAQQQQQHAAFSSAVVAAQQRQQQQQQQQQSFSLSNTSDTTSVSCCDTFDCTRADQLQRSTASSKLTNSFITSVTSVTSLDTGYQGDGEMSRPASRGAGDHSPANAPLQQRKSSMNGGVSRQPSFNQQQQLPLRRQDPMTDSDFFTESDADDIFHRGDRRAQVIDGQLYGPLFQPAAASVFISEDPQLEDSCMESSGIFTDVENRCDDDLALLRRQDTQDVDMSPDADSTETVKSKRCVDSQTQHSPQPPTQLLSDSQSTCTMQSSLSNDRLSMTTDAGAATTLSNRTSYCSVDVDADVDADETGGGNSQSFDSLREAFAATVTACGEKTTKNSFTQAHTTAASIAGASVVRVSSPRKHASLTSLCNIKNVHTTSSSVITATASCTSNSSVSLTPFFGSKQVVSPLNARSPPSSSSVCSSKHSLSNAAVDNKVRLTPRVKKSPVSRTTSASASNSLLASPRNATSPSPSPPNYRKTHSTPNKWDAVMSKIASNKLLLKKNYSDVKSKVSTGVSGGGNGGATPNAGVRRSPSSVSCGGAASGALSAGRASPGAARLLTRTSPHSSQQPTDTGAGVHSPQNKRLIQGAAAAKRGRSYSKDSQKSSQSDLSHTSGSPKLLAKTPLRAAKKRDVRNLSISPTDLGPPPKTQQTANGSSTRAKPVNITLTQKRSSTNNIHNVAVSPCNSSSSATNITTTPNTTITSTASNSTTTPGSNSLKGSPPSKKFTLLSARRLDVKTTPPKSPLKDHNRLITTPTQQQQQHQSITTTTVNNKNGISKPQTPTTENHENSNGMHHHLNNNNNNNNKEGSTVTTTAAASRNNSETSSPTLSQQHQQHGRKTAGNIVALEKVKTSTKLQTNSRKLLHKQQQPRSTEDAATPTEPTLNPQELQQLKHLNRHSCNGRLDYRALEQHLQQTAEAQQHQHKGIEAMGVLLKYLVYDLDAFACPAIKNEQIKAKESLSKTLLLLDETKSACTELQDQLCDKEAYYTQREEELQALHRGEMEKAQLNLSELQMHAKDQISALKSELGSKDAELRRSLDCYRLEMDNKLSQKQQHLLAAEQREKSLLARITLLEKSDSELRESAKSAQHVYEQHLQTAAERERELSDKLKLINKELDALRETKESSVRELKDKLNLSQDEITVLRSSSRRSINESMGNSPRNSSSASAASMEITRLQSEAESLRCVLELKQKEISKLTKANEELMRDADERVALQAKISLLESRHEMLQSELEIKSDKEKDFQRQIDEMQKAFNHETVKRTRLSYDNEALQWQLKQRSEQLHIVEAKLQELSSQDLQTSQTSSIGSLNRSNLNGSSLVSFQVDADVSPPASPIIKGVIEKTDSVSWVLEMDDDTPEAAACKMVKRAGSFRSVERSPSTRRQLSVSANAVTGSTAFSNGCNMSHGPNPLSQSMSATSVIRQHSNETVEFLGRANQRIRSKSVSVKSPEPTAAVINKSNKKLMRQASVGNSRKNELLPTVWTEPMSTSSPYCNNMRPRSSTMKSTAPEVVEHCEEELFRRSSRKLITCDSSALNTGERLEMRALPTHSSVHDLKALKKSQQQIQESAGEAMVSGTNSEDEGCSASSDEVASSSASTTSSSATSTGSTSSLNNIKNHHMSLEEVLLLEKINSLNGTPMEVSWSDEGEAYAPTGSTV